MPAPALLMAAALMAKEPPPLCAPLPGATAVLADPALRWIVVRAVAGTLELPALFGDLVCAAAERGPVTVALDYPPGEQGELDAFLASDGGPAATQRFLAQKRWAQLDQDGRASVGLFRLLDRLRRLMAQGRVAAVVPLQSAPGPGLLLALDESQTEVGAPVPGRDGPGTLRLRAASLGGRAWNCAPTCDYHRVPADGLPRRGVAPGATPADAGALELGGPVTAALPAARFAERERIRKAGAWGFFDDLFP